jgi:glycosyltransferase involved in cell wall biosynthesis
VWQRPQQILSRFGRSRAVLYVEEPVFVDDRATGSLDLTTPSAGVHRVVPRLPSRVAHSYDESADMIRALVLDLTGEGGPLGEVFRHAVQWFYTPMPAPLMVGAFGERGIVYDCMDELAQFRFAPPELAARERLLISKADVVFTGGRQLFESKSRHHGNVHFFGCGVDADHFARARRADTAVPSELRDLPRPVLGYFGVVDERLDYELIDRLARSFASGSVVFVGPVVKVDPRELPNRNNIHWLGQRPYAQLPEYVKGFDVCLMPFALNEATEFINPTKTLEYMAAGKPIVSTAVPDVVRNFAPIVSVARSGDEFVEATRVATMPDGTRIEAGIARAREATWESIVEAMDRLVARAMRRPHSEAGSAAQIMAMRRRSATGGAASRPDSVNDGTANVA